MKNYIITQHQPNTIIYNETKDINLEFDKLTPGFYKPETLSSMFTPTVYQFIKINYLDKLVKYKSGIIFDALNKITEFCDEKVISMYEKLEFSHKMGILFHGKHGTGKTSSAFIIGQELVDNFDFIFLDCTNVPINLIKKYIEIIRKHQDNPILIFVDEFDNSIQMEENGWLTFMDGTSSVKNVIIIGCTNHISRIPDRISKRPSRIKHVIEISSFPYDVYLNLIKEKCSDMDSNLQCHIASLCEENCFTIDQVKHFIILMMVEGAEINYAVKQIRKYQ